MYFLTVEQFDACDIFANDTDRSRPSIVIDRLHMQLRFLTIIFLLLLTIL